MNPRSERRRFRFRRVTRKRNPTRRAKTHSPAMRRKIGLAVKRAMAARRAGSSSPRRRSVARSSTMPVRYSSPMRRRRSSNFRSMPRRRSGIRRFGGGMMNRAISVKSMFSKPILVTAGGAVASVALVNFVANVIPANNYPTATKLATAVIVPLGGAILLRKNTCLAQGMLIGGASMIIEAVVDYIKTTYMSGTAAVAPATVSDFPRDGYMIRRNNFGVYFDAATGRQVSGVRSVGGQLMDGAGRQLEVVGQPVQVPNLPLFTSPAAFPAT
jgi:hypothetical protein